MDTVLVDLPCGFEAEGRRYRQAELRPLRGEDEAALLELGEAVPPAVRVTALLTRALVRLGPCEPVTADAVRALVLGDREALLLHLRRLAEGDRMPCVVTCPACEKPMDLDLSAESLLLPAYPDAAAVYERRLVADGRPWHVRFRLPNGGDLEAVAAHGREGAAGDLLRRCVMAAVPVEDGLPVPSQSWPGGLRHAVAAAMSELDPQADIQLQLRCPECEAEAGVPLIASEYLLAELDRRGRRLFREVHALALHYHWSEREIMAMSPARRRLYLELLEEQYGREGA